RAGIPIPVPQQQILFDQQKAFNKINNIEQN
ncbi:MAG: hypothetical protein RLZZ381_3650, partial [Cyanobacteriota bacterium]